MTDATHAPKDATDFTRDANRAAARSLPSSDVHDFEDAQRGFIAALPDGVLRSPAGGTVWSLADYAFLEQEEAPATVHPSLWRQARLNLRHGLFEVTDRIYQVRGLDISNMTIVEGDTGVIVIDTLLTAESARAALELYWQHRGRRPVIAVIYTHSHGDHYGGVRGVIDDADVLAGRVAVIAPTGFLDEVASESVLAGPAMLRRAYFQFGGSLHRGPDGHVDVGLGKATSRGTTTLIAPTWSIKDGFETHRIDGVEIVFQLTPGAEAPAEMMLYFPQIRALNLAENATHTLHNVYPIRGAQVRDTRAWARFLDDALDRFGGQTDVAFAQHHWPVWGNRRVLEYLSKQRDLYKYIHDQSLRLMNRGYTGDEIAHRLTLPKSLADEWHTRGYYGTLGHSARSVYQRYLGWYDANPSHLDVLPPVERARKYVDYMGGADAAIARARIDFQHGEYRFVAEVMNHVVFADPSNEQARELGANALEQLGYAAESATYRNAFLTGALELRHGVPRFAVRAPISPDVVRAMSPDLIFDYLAGRLNPTRSSGVTLVVNWMLSDLQRSYRMKVSNCVLTARADRWDEEADASVTLERSVLDRLILRELSMPDAVARQLVAVSGKMTQIVDLFELFDDAVPLFEVVEPGSDAE
ncbi:MAG TPA: alkyl sulfatase dimerization domain-containing protein [Chloroflexota bacterium]|jgi:alkyl sulfatase BDS1-like metallo-beta-lactamase superfamily hydrolase